MKATNFPTIIFSGFNTTRAIRGANAARFDIITNMVDKAGVYKLWMSKKDIKENLFKFPHCRYELSIGMAAYAQPIEG